MSSDPRPAAPDNGHAEPRRRPKALRFAVFFGLCAWLCAGWWIAERHAGAWLERHGFLFAALRPDGRAPQGALAPLLALGDIDAPLQAVLACDLIDAQCRAVLGWLIAWQSDDPERAVLPGRHDTRIVFLNRAQEESRTIDVAAAFVALDVQHRFWPVLEALAPLRQPFTVAAIQAALDHEGGDVARWQRDRVDPDQALRARTDRTMAEALGIPSKLGVLVSGRPLAAPQTATEAALRQALHQRALDLSAAITASGGDVAKAQLKLLRHRQTRQIDRYRHWILRGERVAVLPTRPERSSQP